MKKALFCACFVTVLGLASLSFAKGQYNDVPADDPQFMECIVYAKKHYTGGDDKSPIAGQSKAVAYCECMWNETPEDFKGHLVKFAESPKGKTTDKTCAKYSNWE